MNELAKLAHDTKKATVKIGGALLVIGGALYVLGVPTILFTPLALVSGVVLGKHLAKRDDKRSKTKSQDI